MESQTFNPLYELRRQMARQEACKVHAPIDRPVSSVWEAEHWWTIFQQCSPEARQSHLRWLALNDLYFLLVYILNFVFLKKEWHLKTIREIEHNHDNVIDVSTRGSGKTCKKTTGLVIQKILNQPEITIGIFSHTRPTAQSFLDRPIKETFESNERLKELFPDILYENPKRESPCWSVEKGIIVKRKSIGRPEATVEAWGLIDGLPTRKHFDLLCYDDIQKGPLSPYMIEQVDQYLQSSMGLSAKKPPTWWMCGVFFRGGSIYENLTERGFGLTRVRPAINPDGTSPIWSDEEVTATRKLVSPGVWACEYLVDPSIKVVGEGFEESWIKYHEGSGSVGANGVNLKSSHIYMLVDPGYGKKGKGSKTSIQVVGLTPYRKYVWLDGIVAPLNIIDRVSWTMKLHRQYSPLKVGYEHYGLQGDVDLLKKVQDEEGYHFSVMPLSHPKLDKMKRITWLMPPFKDGDFLLPRAIAKRRINDEEIDVVKYFLDREYKKWPATKEMDILDSLSWIMYQPFGASFPEGYDDNSIERKRIDFDEEAVKGSWMAD